MYHVPCTPSRKRDLARHQSHGEQFLQLHDLVAIEAHILLHAPHVRVGQAWLVDVLDPIPNHQTRHKK
jgi:hypothetical protein